MDVYSKFLIFPFVSPLCTTDHVFFSPGKTVLPGKDSCDPLLSVEKYPPPPPPPPRQKYPSWKKFLSPPPGGKSIGLSLGWENITDVFSQQVADCSCRIGSAVAEFA